MWSRYRFSHRQVSEPWRSSKMLPFQSFEDYWEDASVSLKCPDDWRMPEQAMWDYSPDLDGLAPCFPPDRTIEEEERRCVEETERIQQCGADGLPVSDEQACSLTEEDAQTIEEEASDSCDGFPPPIASCGTRSFKKDGRFVLKEVHARPHAFFRAQRENGRLRLQLIQSNLADDEDAVLDSEDESRDLIGEGSDDQMPREEMLRSSGIGTTESVTEHWDKLQNFRGTTNMGEILDSTSLEKIESGVCLISSEKELAVASYDENGLVNCIVESFGIEATRHLPQPPPIWMTGEASLNLWPTSQIFLPQALTRVSPVVGF